MAEVLELVEAQNGVVAQTAGDPPSREPSASGYATKDQPFSSPATIHWARYFLTSRLRYAWGLADEIE